MSRPSTEEITRKELCPDEKMLTAQKDDNPRFSLRLLSYDKAVAPLLRQPVAPFDRTERKRAHTSALFYSECFLHGIETRVADTAALQAQGAYDKWWVKSTASFSRLKSMIETESRDGESCKKRERLTKKPKYATSDSEKCFDENTVTYAIASAKVAIISNDSQDEETYDDVSSESVQIITNSSQHKGFISNFPLMSKNVNIEAVKQLMIEDLRLSGGNVGTPEFLKCQQILEKFFIQNGLRDMDLSSLRGNWLTISKPAFTECLGKNEKGENKYSLGRISFDMFKPTGLSCSFQASFNHIQSIDPNDPGRPLHIPRKLMQDIQKGDCRLQTYDIVNAITIEAGQDRKGNSKDEGDRDCYIVPRPIRAILTTQGYSIPDPTIPNRLSVWFSGGSLEVQDEEKDFDEWKHIFDMSSAPSRDIREYANSLAAKVILGAHIPDRLEQDGTLRFDLKRPIGGHGSVFCDVIYMDENLRIMHGHHDSVYVCVRVPD